MENSIENKVVIVTGGATGIGLSIVETYLEHGAKLTIIVDINEELGTAAVGKLSKKYGQDKAVFIKCDVFTNLEETYQIVIDKYGAIDVLVNNAGIVSEKCIRKTMNINIIALMEWSIKFYDYMRKDRGGKGGTIINISSLYGLQVTPFFPYYHASKYAVIGFTKSLGHEYNYKKSGVRVIVLCPGFTHTEIHANLKPRDDDLMEDVIKEGNSHVWQDADAVGKASLEIFSKAESGTVWVVIESQAKIFV